MTRQRPLIVYLVACLVALGSTLRYVGYFVSHPSRWTILGLLIAFYALFATFPRLFRRSHPRVHLFLAVQTCLLLALAVVTTIEDVVALPFLSLILLAMTILPLKIGFRWIALFTALMIGLMVVYGIQLLGSIQSDYRNGRVFCVYNGVVCHCFIPPLCIGLLLS